MGNGDPVSVGIVWETAWSTSQNCATKGRCAWSMCLPTHLLVEVRLLKWVEECLSKFVCFLEIQNVIIFGNKFAGVIS